VPYKTEQITTPLSIRVSGLRMKAQICAVPIIRSALPMADVLREYVPSATVGHVVIQRDERTAKPKFLLDKLPKLRADMAVMLVDPMLATGGSALAAIDHVLRRGASEDKVIFANIISCPEGISAIMKRHPKVTLVTAWVDKGLNDVAYILPGLGDFGDRYWGTTS
jgi:uracil phosphoribosyltransferase